MNLRTTSGLSDSNTTFGANPAFRHSSSHTPRNPRVPARHTNGASAKSARQIASAFACSLGMARYMRSRNTCEVRASDLPAPPGVTVRTRTSQRASLFAWLMTKAACGTVARNAAMASTVMDVAASTSMRTVLRSWPFACAMAWGISSNAASSGATFPSSASPQGVSRMLRPTRSNSFASSSPSRRRIACVSAGWATPSRLAEFVICWVCATS